MRFLLNKKLAIYSAIGAVFLGVVIVAIIVFGTNLFLGRSKQLKGAVVSNGPGCADIGSDMFKRGGSAVDAAIATLVCEGVIVPQSMGIGGGFFATIFTKETGKVETIVARETAPLAAHSDMFKNQSITGAIATAVPGEILGYWKMHKIYGKLPWKDLFTPTINLCKNGHIVSKFLATVLVKTESRIRNESSMSEIFINPSTGSVWQEGDIMRRPQLGKTLEIIAEKGPSEMYGGSIGKNFVQDVQRKGGIITDEDMLSYNVRWEEPIRANITGGYTLYTTPVPSSGVLLAFILNILNPLYTENHLVYWQRIVESFKHAFGQRTKLGDLYFEPESVETLKNITNDDFIQSIRNLIYDDRTFKTYDYYGANFTNSIDHGTANMAVIAPNGDAVIATSTVNNYFGTKIRSVQTGIILNDEMDDFSTPGVVNGFGIPSSPSNYIKPGKRPMSSMCPSLILDKNGNPVLLIGAAGGSKITTSVAQSIIRYLILNESLHMAVQAGRIHHQLAPMYVEYEPEVDKNVRMYLTSVGHDLEDSSSAGFSAMTAIGYKNGNPEPIYDRRRSGSVSIVEFKV